MATTAWREDGCVLVGGYACPAVEYTLTDEAAASSYGQPVLLVSIDGEYAGVYGPCDILPDTTGGLLPGCVAGRMVLTNLQHGRVSGHLAEIFSQAWLRSL